MVWFLAEFQMIHANEFLRRVFYVVTLCNTPESEGIQFPRMIKFYPQSFFIIDRWQSSWRWLAWPSGCTKPSNLTQCGECVEERHHRERHHSHSDGWWTGVETFWHCQKLCKSRLPKPNWSVHTMQGYLQCWTAFGCRVRAVHWCTATKRTLQCLIR